METLSHEEIEEISGGDALRDHNFLVALLKPREDLLPPRLRSN